MSQSNDDILINLMAECSDQIMAGAPLASCLARYPEHAIALEPLLQTVMDVRQFRAVPARAAAVAAQSRAEFIAAVRDLAPAQRSAAPAPWSQQWAAWWQKLRAGFTGPAKGWSQPRTMPMGLAFALLAFILAGVLATGAISASAKALPGDFLYPIKLASENAWVLMTRDPAARENVLAEIADRRVEEALTIVRIGRPAVALVLEGVIEEIHAQTWVVSGQTVTLTAETRVEGQPVIGSRVEGHMDAPGDGRLLLTDAKITSTVVPIDRPAAAPAAATRPTPTSTPEPLAGGEAVAAPAFPTQAHSEPMDRPSLTPSATPTRTPTSTRTRMPTKTPKPTRQATPTPIVSLTPPRDALKQTYYGWVKAISADHWTIGDITVDVDGSTQYLNNPGLGWEVQVNMLVRSDGSYLALQIIGLRAPEATAEPLEFTGAITAIEAPWWSIGPYRVKVDAETRLENDPQVGDRAHVRAERGQGGEIRALQITALLYVERQFEGVVSAYDGEMIVVDGRTLIIDGNTEIIGEVVVGAAVEVAAWEMPDGQLVARVIMVVSGPTATASPTATSAPTPTSTGTPTPTLTASPTPTGTSTPIPTITATPT